MTTTMPESDDRTAVFDRNCDGDGRPENPLWVLTIEPFSTGREAPFDLDEALTLPDYEPTAAEPAIFPPEQSVSLMPTVCCTGRVCAVCMEEFAGGTCGKMMPCSHVYHEECIAVWLAQGGSCPLCRCHSRKE